MTYPDQQMIDKIPSLAEDKISLFEVVRMQGTANQINGTDKVLFHYCVLGEGRGGKRREGGDKIHVHQTSTCMLKTI